MKRIGLIGCGVVGRTLGARLLRSGFELVAHDRHEERATPLLERGASWAATSAELGADCDALVSALPYAEDALDALVGPKGAWSRAPRRMLHVDTSTIGVVCARRLAAEATERGIRYLDAPISAAEATETGTALALFVGGNADYFDLAQPVLRAMAEHVHYVGGPAGKGQVVKLVNNLASHALTVVLGDALALGVKSGVSVDLLHAALHDGTAQCRVLDELLPASAFRDDWRPGLRLDLALKDLDLARELAAEAGIEQRLLPLVRATYERTKENGWGDLSSHTVLRLQEKAGVSFRSSIFAGVRGADELG